MRIKIFDTVFILICFVMLKISKPLYTIHELNRTCSPDLKFFGNYGYIIFFCIFIIPVLVFLINASQRAEENRLITNQLEYYYFAWVWPFRILVYLLSCYFLYFLDASNSTLFDWFLSGVLLFLLSKSLLLNYFIESNEELRTSKSKMVSEEFFSRESPLLIRTFGIFTIVNKDSKRRFYLGKLKKNTSV